MKLPLSKLICCFLLSFAALSSYAQEDTVNTESVPKELNYKVTSIKHIQKDVYAVGSYREERVKSYNNEVACYWKNGKLFNLGDQDGIIRSSEALAIAFDKNDVYIFGRVDYNEKKSISTCWKNGKWEREINLELPKTDEEDNKYDLRDLFIKDMAILKGEVYLLGNTASSYDGRMFCWKEGKLIPLEIPATPEPDENNEEKYAFGKALSVYNNDVYIAGYLTTDYNKCIPVYWKNGKCTILNLPSSLNSTYTFNQATDIVVNDEGIWISGYYENRNDNKSVACYWKNGQIISISPWYARAKTTSIWVEGKDVYIGGAMQNYDPSGKRIACYWKNGELNPVYETLSTVIDPCVLKILPGLDNRTPVIYSNSNVDIDNKYYTSYNSPVYQTIAGKYMPLNLQDGINKSLTSKAAVNDVYVSKEGDVYAMGYMVALGDSIEKAVYWKNGIKNEVNFPSQSIKTGITSIAIEKDDQVITGVYQIKGSESLISCYWRSGKRTDLDSSTVMTKSKLINGHLYLMGFKQKNKNMGDYEGFYQVDGKFFKLTLPKGSIFKSTIPTNLEVNGKDLYISGYILKPEQSTLKKNSFKIRATLWKNGIATIIPVLKPEAWYIGLQITSENNKFGVTGTYSNSGTGGFAWTPLSPVKHYPIILSNKDKEELIKIPPLEEDYMLSSLNTSLFFIKNKQKHALVSTDSRYVNFHTQNGKVTFLPLTPCKFGAKNYIHSLTLNDNKVYLGGYYLDYEGNQKACYWVDGKRVELN